MRNSFSSPRSAFTLIELSIVLVIIGLVVGGVLVGQGLIKAAEIRATVGQYEKFNAVVNTFRTKYNGIPGDLLFSEATAFGFFDVDMNGESGQGDGDGLIEHPVLGNPREQLGEVMVFWRHLSDANLIEGNFGPSLVSGGRVPSDTATAQMPKYFPLAKMGRGNYFTVSDDSGQNFYLIMGVSTITLPSSSAAYSLQLTPVETYNIDLKVDDGAPNTGLATAEGTVEPFLSTQYATWSASPTNECMTSGGAQTSPTATYNRNMDTGGNVPACGLKLRFN